jgi:3'-5' exoribonuclease
MPDQKPHHIANFVPGETIVAFLALRGKQLREHDGKPFIRFEFADKSGRIMAVTSDNMDAFWSAADQNDVVKVRAVVGTWNDKKTLRIQQMRRAKPEEFDPGDFLPQYEGDKDALWGELLQFADSVNDQPLREVLANLTGSEEMRGKFLNAPAGKLWHHVYLGGLAEHTVNVAALVNAACERYPLANRNLAMAGAILHDIGKIEAFEVSSTIEYGDVGRLVGHVVLGERLVSTWCRSVPELNALHADQLCHVVLAHELIGDQRSPIDPMTLEAAIVAAANQLDATAGAFARILGRERETGQSWSAWVNTLDRHIYLK